MKCKHDNADHFKPGDLYEHWHVGDKGPTLHAALCEQFRCLYCGAWLSLGPAKDDGEHAREVAIEIRAAEIAILLSTAGGCEMSLLEQCGFRDAPLAMRGGGSISLDTSSTRAGYLAHCIIDHNAENQDV